MSLFRRFFTPGVEDGRVNVSILSPKTTIVNTIVIIIYSGLLLMIFDSISFTEENSKLLAASILTLVLVASICISAATSYAHYIKYTKPLLYLANAAREVSKGNYKIQLPNHRLDGKTDEIDALYQDFNTMVNDLNSTEMLKSSFVSNISHELKTPIAVISNYSSLLLEDNLAAEEKQNYIQKIQKTIKDLSELVSNILQISKLDNNQIKATFGKFNLSEEIIQCV